MNAIENERNADGLPDIEGQTEWPRNWAQITGGPGTQPLTAKIDQSGSHNVNHHLPYLIGISIVATAALVIGILVLVFGPRWIDRQAELTKAQVRAEYSQAVAEAKAQADQAGTVAQLWKNRVDKLEAEINANRRR